MSHFRSSLPLLAAALGLASCAKPVPEAPARPAVTQQKAPEKSQPAAAPKPPKKPVRMNGRGEVSSIPIDKLFELQQSDRVLLYDARPGFFYNLGHISGAIHLPKTGVDEEIMKREPEIKAALASGKVIVVYCTNLLCPDARTVANHLAGFGYSSSVLSGGWDAWKDAGLLTE